MKSKKVKRFFLYAGVVLIVVWTLAPVVWLFISSISPHKELLDTSQWLPENPTLKNYVTFFNLSTHTGESFLSALRNSIIIATSVTIICLAASTLAAYALARLEFKGKKFLVVSMLSTRMLPTVALIIPFFVLVVYYVGSFVQLYDTRINLIILYTSFILGFDIWIMRGYLMSIPKELEEAGLIDGLNRWGVLFKIILPLSAPGLVATGIFSFLLAWNEFLLALIFTKSNQSITLTLFIQELGSQYTTSWEQVSAAGFIAILPPVILALLFQKFIIKGLTAGSVKG
ncbi:carbohydrate ABC transporter permease [Halothermothrix orenii]|uniref:Binding-protein-dependent transport systems inner membrane component n=1 Tax=Halothermothrix orenii (strain H 168 / OCM 544 / DSM 9562) TaxID=373903 RepID=B8CZL5_HALOH|nr:carbohydrate ABC transporter permease [Halothermothrix orenii]ACL70734.1 binding-protein-dependent transport systems inner membrane component [Halothermothrix orenii H 168]